MTTTAAASEGDALSAFLKRAMKISAGRERRNLAGAPNVVWFITVRDLVRYVIVIGMLLVIADSFTHTLLPCLYFR